jgi:hypothetical protein
LQRPQSVYALQKLIRPTEAQAEPDNPASLLSRLRRAIR